MIDASAGRCGRMCRIPGAGPESENAELHCSFGEPFAHSPNSDLPAVRISTDDAYIVGV
jgi:hypothetical protein